MAEQDVFTDERDPIFQTEVMRALLDDVKCLGCHGGGQQAAMDGSDSDTCAHCHGEGVDIDRLLIEAAKLRSAPSLTVDEAHEALRWQYSLPEANYITLTTKAANKLYSIIQAQR